MPDAEAAQPGFCQGKRSMTGRCLLSDSVCVCCCWYCLFVGYFCGFAGDFCLCFSEILTDLS